MNTNKNTNKDTNKNTNKNTNTQYLNNNIIKFLERVSMWKLNEIEFNYNCKKPIKFEEIEKYDKKWWWIYFLANVENTNKRNRDNDIKEKHYIAFDIDLRNNLIKKNNLSKEEKIDSFTIKEYAWLLVEKLENIELLKDWVYIVYSWNGLHVYYIWKWKKFNSKEYEDAVCYLQYIWNKEMTEILHCDIAVKNIWRILRLPWTTNYKNYEKWVKAEILFENEEVYNNWWSKVISMIPELAKKYNKLLEEQKKKKIDEWLIKQSIIKQREQKTLQKKEYKSDINIVEELNERVNIVDLILEDYPELEARDSSDERIISLYDTVERNNIWAFVFRNWNFLIHTWSTRIPNKKETYNVYSYLRDIRWWDHKTILEYANKLWINVKKDNSNNSNNSNNNINNNSNNKNKKIQEKENKKKIDEQDLTNIDFERIYKSAQWSQYTLWLDVLDDKYWWMRKWAMVVLFWEAGMWKTEFAFYQAIENAKRWKKVMFITLEMTKEDLLYRTAMKRLWIPVKEAHKWLSKERIKQIKSKIKEILDTGLIVYYPEDKKLSDILELIEQLKEKWYELIYIDNLWKIHSDKYWQTELDLQNEITKKITDIAVKEDVCIVMIHHEKKWSDKEINNKKKWNNAMRWSQKIVDDAELIIRIWRDKRLDEIEEEWMEEEKRKVRFIVTKNRVYWVEWPYDLYFKDWKYYKDYDEMLLN